MDASRLYMDAVVLSRPGKLAVATTRIYMQDRPEITASEIIGLEYFAVPFGISRTTQIPEPGFSSDYSTVETGIVQFLFITLVNTKGLIIFNQIPAASLFVNTNGAADFYRMKKYSAKNIDLSKSYYSFAPGAGILLDTKRVWIANLGFYLKGRKK